jgi:hypothetical protein
MCLLRCCRDLSRTRVSGSLPPAWGPTPSAYTSIYLRQVHRSLTVGNMHAAAAALLSPRCRRLSLSDGQRACCTAAMHAEPVTPEPCTHMGSSMVQNCRISLNITPSLQSLSTRRGWHVQKIGHKKEQWGAGATTAFNGRHSCCQAELGQKEHQN